MSDHLLINGRIHTMDPALPQARAILIRDGIIAAVGGDDIAALAHPRARITDLGGRLVLPGFQDAHTHLLSGGTDLATAAQLYEAEDLATLAQLIRSHAAAHPDLPLLVGAGWQPGLFGDHNLTAAWLDPLTGSRPALIYDSSFHSACFNTAALALAGITADTNDPPNGHILRDATGQATGMLHEEAIPWALERLPGFTDDQLFAGLMAGQAHANRHGITGVIDAKITAIEVRIYARAARENLLTLRVAGAAHVSEADTPETALARLSALRSAHPGPDFHINAAKFFMDGVFENRTAACLVPYADAEGGNAPCMFRHDQTLALMTALDAARFQIHVHVIGDAACARALDGLEAALAANGPWPACHQITHLQLVAPADFPRLARLAMANIQPLWARFDPKIPDIALDMIGHARLSQTYAFRDMVNLGASFAMSSDWPVSTLNPFEIIETAITRQARAHDHPGPPFLPGQALSVTECVAGYTINAARASWRDGYSGRLSPGFSADLIVTDQDIFSCAPARISATRVLLTLFRGQEVWRDPSLR